MCPPISSVPEKVLPQSFNLALPPPPGLPMPGNCIAPPPGLASCDAPPPGLSRAVRDVWLWNFDEEFRALLATRLHSAIVTNVCIRATIAMSVRFPFSVPRKVADFQVLRRNLYNASPVQVGIVVADVDGVPHGVWNFNLSNESMDKLTQSQVHASSNFHYETTEGVSPHALVHRIVNSFLVSADASSPLWITFGPYEFGYLLKVLSDDSLTSEPAIFEHMLVGLCPNRMDLAAVPTALALDGSVHANIFDTSGTLHGAGDDALAILELYSSLVALTDRYSDERKSNQPLRVPIDMETKANPCSDDNRLARHHNSQHAGPSIWSLKARRATTTPSFIAKDAPASLWASAAKQVAAEGASSALVAALPRLASPSKKAVGKQAVLWSDIVRARLNTSYDVAGHVIHY